MTDSPNVPNGSDRPAVTPPDISSGTDMTTEPPKPARKDDKQWLPFVLLSALLLVGVLGFWLWNNRGDSDPVVTPTTQTTTEATTQVTTPPPATETVVPEETTEVTEETTTETEVTEEEQPVEQDQISLAAENFVSNIGSGKSGQEWADSMRTMVSSAFYESLKYADPASIPQGVASVDVSGGGGDTWRVIAQNDAGEELYRFTLTGFKTVDGGGALLVTSMDMPQSDEPQYDSEGHPIRPPVPPLTESAYQSLQAQSVGVAKAYLEFQLGESIESRQERVSAAVHGGEYPEFRDFEVTPNSNIQTFAPENGYLLEAVAGEPVVDGFVTLAMEVAYADASQSNPAPIETLLLGTDFNWNEDSKSWQAVGLRVLDVL